MASDLGLGSCRKYSWSIISLALGLLAGLRLNRPLSSAAPAAVRRGNLARTTEPAVALLAGSRSDLALGSLRNPGQVSSVGTPHSSKILPDNVLVAAVLQDLDLPQARDRQPVAVVGLDLEPFQRDDPARCYLLGPCDPAVCALFYVVQFVVVLHAPRLAEPASLEP
ncbi:hypothetical protein VSDG_04393 [Cytospora chrysosperma]|uniref:Uncharacterized protein n=1 Tax=Cytospora chrysosperma TaxID=252740 RepID=A0A423W4M8_CYTCH|nr:hypothetical protein VSDG_04393 [Valsa sordida]